MLRDAHQLVPDWVSRPYSAEQALCAGTRETYLFGTLLFQKVLMIDLFELWAVTFLWNGTALNMNGKYCTRSRRPRGPTRMVPGTGSLQRKHVSAKRRRDAAAALRRWYREAERRRLRGIVHRARGAWVQLMWHNEISVPCDRGRSSGMYAHGLVFVWLSECDQDTEGKTYKPNKQIQ